jgi:hypothetical protein
MLRPPRVHDARGGGRWSTLWVVKDCLETKKATGVPVAFAGGSGSVPGHRGEGPSGRSVRLAGCCFPWIAVYPPNVLPHDMQRSTDVLAHTRMVGWSMSLTSTPLHMTLCPAVRNASAT